MLIEFLVGQLFLALFNVGNAFFDAYRILANKHIAHALNFIAYLLVAIVICLLLGIHFHFAWGWLPYGQGILFLASAFFNRQFTFDIPLNLRRGLAWNYQSTADVPKSITDRIERAIFGTGQNVGTRIAKVYAACYVVTITLWIWII